MIRDHPQVAVRLLRIVGERLASVEDQVEDLAFRSAEQRVARIVVRMLEERGSARLLVSHEEIAKAAGVARETVTKVLKTMERNTTLGTSPRPDHVGVAEVIVIGSSTRTSIDPRPVRSEGSQPSRYSFSVRSP